MLWEDSPFLFVVQAWFFYHGKIKIKKHIKVIFGFFVSFQREKG